MRDQIAMSPNPIVRYLNKSADELTKADLIRFIEDNGIEMLNLRYTGWDGRLKTLNFIINNKEHLESILAAGERVDGSSLFPFIEAGSSDLYVIPRYKTAFVNPFTEIPSIDILCSYYNRDGEPFESAPDYILRKAHKSLQDKTGLDFEVMGELEYYVIDEDQELFQAVDQRGYHEASPFCKFETLRTEAMKLIAQCGGQIKYGHSEVGNFRKEGKIYEQNEIEFLPTHIEDAADQLVIAKWIIRTLAMLHGVTVTFAPKITAGKAGSGLHVHTRLMKDGKNVMVGENGLSEIAKKAIAGYLDLAPSLTAFGNTNPTSYFRLVPHQEAPTNICWGDRNRSVLVRVPLGWSSKKSMANHANPQEPFFEKDFSSKQTVEFRCPDGSADIYMLLAGLTVAARRGFEMDNALEYAAENYVSVNIFDDEHKDKVAKLNQLPTSCFESAHRLEEQAAIYRQYDVFPESVLNWFAGYLKAYQDQSLREEIGDEQDKVLALVSEYFHCG